MESFFPNTIINYIQLPPWECLLKRVGDSAMFFLLVNTFIFVELPNNCYLQVTGVSVNILNSIPQRIQFQKNIRKQPTRTNTSSFHYDTKVTTQGPMSKKKQRLNIWKRRKSKMKVEYSTKGNEIEVKSPLKTTLPKHERDTIARETIFYSNHYGEFYLPADSKKN